MLVPTIAIDVTVVPCWPLLGVADTKLGVPVAFTEKPTVPDVPVTETVRDPVAAPDAIVIFAVIEVAVVAVALFTVIPEPEKMTEEVMVPLQVVLDPVRVTSRVWL